MPRMARKKYPGAIYHIMCRSISELLLFRDDSDKDYYLELLGRYINKFNCSIYAYCLMDNHLHIHLDPKGFDISKFMHCLNTAYVRYYNTKYQRKGSLFQDRFQSRILDTDRYNLAVSAYIHNNPKDLPKFRDREEHYEYSSYGIYLNMREDKFKLIDKSFIMHLLNANESNFIEKYKKLTKYQLNKVDLNNVEGDIIEIENKYVRGRRVILRELSPAKIISIISTGLRIDDNLSIATKSHRKYIEFRAFCAYILRVLGGLSYIQICRYMCNITVSGCSKLCEKGYNLLKSGDPKYIDIYNELIVLAA